MLPVLRIGPAAIQTVPLVLLIGAWLALELSGRQAARRGLDGGEIQTAGFLAGAGGLLAARLGYVVEFWPAYRQNLVAILSPSLQGLSLWPGIVVGLAVAGAWMALRRLPWRTVLDALAPGLAVFAAAYALASWVGGAAVGIETEVPWAVSLWEVPRQPVQIYDLAGSLVILGLLLRLGQNVPAPGLGGLLLLALYAALQVLLEPLRAERLLFAGSWRGVQVIGLLVLLMALWQMRAWYRAPTPTALAVAEHGSDLPEGDESVLTE